MPTEPINGREPEFSEEDLQRKELGPRGVPGKDSPAKMAPQREKKQPKDVDPGQTASGDRNAGWPGCRRSGSGTSWKRRSFRFPTGG
jgi:hypothetical protein